MIRIWRQRLENFIRNEKTKSTDEFLINKKDPLTQPPDFDSIPKPGSVTDSKAEKNSIEKILKTSNTKSSKAQSKPSSTEDSILRQIKK